MAPIEAAAPLERIAEAEAPIVSEVTDLADPEPRPLVLSGRVLDFASELPIAGARVRAISTSMDEPVEATSASDGRFEFLGLEFAARATWSVDVELRVDAPEHASFYSRVQGTAPKDAPLEIDAGDLRLRVGTRVSGRVVDAETRAPRAGAALFLFDASRPSMTGLGADEQVRCFVLAAGESDALGRFTIPRAVAASLNLGLFARTEDAFGSCALPIAEGLGEIEVEIELRARPALDVEVVDERGAAIEGARVTLVARSRTDGLAWRSAHRLQVGARNDGLARQPSDARGRVHFDCLPPIPEADTYAVVAYDDAHAQGVLTGVRADSGSVRLVMPDRVLLQQLAGRVVDVDGNGIAGAQVECERRVATADALGRFAFGPIALSQSSVSLFAQAEDHASASLLVEGERARSGSVEGAELVLAATARVEGIALDTLGAPIAGARLDLSQSARTGVLRSARTADDGSFRIEGCVAGSAELSLADSLEFVRGCTLRVEAPAVDLRFECERADPPSASLDARVIDARTGAALPVLAATLVARPDGAGRYVPVEGRPLASLGRVRAPRLHPGRYVLGVAAPGERLAYRSFEVAANETARFEIALGEAFVLEGRVESTGEPLRAVVIAELEGARPEFLLLRHLEEHRFETKLVARPDAEGRFRFELPILGTYAVRLEGERVYDEERVEASAGGSTSIVLRASSSTVLHVTSSSPWPGGFLMIRIREGAGEWQLTREAVPAGTTVDARIEVAPGDVSWELSATDANAPGSGRWRGGAHVVAGREWRIAVD